MDTAFARFDAARLLSLGCLARSCLWRKVWTVCKLQISSEYYPWDKWHNVDIKQSESEKPCCSENKVFISNGKAEWKTYSAHFMLISWLMICLC